MTPPLCPQCRFQLSSWQHAASHEPDKVPPSLRDGVTKPAETAVPPPTFVTPPTERVTKVSGRPKRYATTAERQAAYRARKK